MHQRRLNRLKGYDYTQGGYYFVTVCTKDRIHWFGEIRDSEMILNEWGRIVEICWNDLPNHYANVKLDEYVVMPNHFHGIISIVGNDNVRNDNVRNGFKPFPTFTNTKRHGLPEIMRGFKTFSARRVNEKLTDGKRFCWQKSYYDHIIRNETSSNKIREYIRNNPLTWETDPENSAP